METAALEKLNEEIDELETWLKEHPNHPVDDKVHVRMQLIRKISQKEQLQANKENAI